MATISGNNGEVKIGAVAVGKVTEFTIEESMATERDDAMGDAWVGNKGGKKSWSGSMTVRYDDADAGQDLVDIGDEGTGNFYPDGDSSGKVYKTGSIVVTGVTTRINQDDRSEQAISFIGDGALTEATVA